MKNKSNENTQIAIFLHESPTTTMAIATNKEKEKDPKITLQIIKYIIMDYYQAQPGSKYSLDLFTNIRKNNILKRWNKDNYIRDVNRPVFATRINCWECGHEIFTHNPIVSNKHSKSMKRRYYHFRCGLLKNLVELKDVNNPMPQDYHKFLLGIII